MGFNPEKECLKIKALLNEQGYKKDIPRDTFGVATMQILGTPSRVKAGKWMDSFELFGFITVKGEVVNFA